MKRLIGGQAEPTVPLLSKPSEASGPSRTMPADPSTVHWLQAASLPKVLLHDHLDGGLRLPTLWALMHERGIQPPVAQFEALGPWFAANAHAGSLEKYLQGFALTVAAMASPEALARVAYEAAQDARAQGVVLAEFRIAPLLFEAHGISGDAAVQALLTGLAKSPLPTGLIVCAMRHLPASETARSAHLAARWAGRGHGACEGVVAFDLAGAEFGHPPSEHEQALAIARAAGLPLTLHAGEADGAPRVLEAARLGAKRVGHGVRLLESWPSALVDEAIALGLHLEVCPTSNVHTGVAASIAQHPITELWRAGVSLSVHTDNTLMSCTSLTQEMALLLQHTPITVHDLLKMGEQAAKASFLGASARNAALVAMAQHAPPPGEAALTVDAPHRLAARVDC